jgi:hypothetical protein
MTIRCLYTCSLCDLVDVAVEVPARESTRPVVEWMERICIPAIGADHALRSPGCQPETLENLKIPITNADYIGGPAVQ